MDVASLIRELMIVLAAGAISATFCKRFGISLLVGYLVVGAIVGRGGLQLVLHPQHELELVAEAGALLLLFSVGIEFSISELSKLRWYFLIGGSVQMLLVAAPLTVAARLAGMSPSGALLAGSAGALSSTVLVFRALSEKGEIGSGHGRRAIAVLLFQDVALVPLLLLVPLLTGSGNAPSGVAVLLLVLKSIAFLAGVGVLQLAINRALVPLIWKLRSVELIVLFSISLLGLMCLTAASLGLPPAVGSLAAGIALSGNRLSKQIDTILLPFRETFAAVFFVSLGMLLVPSQFLKEPLLLTTGLLGIIALKMLAAGIALRFVRLPWRKAMGMGLVLAQLGEFSFLLISLGVSKGLIPDHDYQRMLFIGLATLVLTPLLIKQGLKWAGKSEAERSFPEGLKGHSGHTSAVIIGIGPIGSQVASRLEALNVEVALVDLSPVNLHPFGQRGYATFAGDARDVRVLQSLGITERRLAVVCVPSDEVALDIVRSLRQSSPRLAIVVRCRLTAHVATLEKAGADGVVSEEAEASGPLIRICRRWLDHSAGSEATIEVTREY